MIKVCVLTSVHPPFDTRIFHREAKSLLKAGYEVTLVAQHDKDEIVEGVKILSLPKPRNRIERMTRTVWQVYRKALKIDADIYHFHDPELIPIGLLYKLMGKRVVYDVHEWVRTQIMRKHWLPLWLRRPTALVISSIEQLAGRWVDRIVAATPAIERGFPQGKTVLIQNFPIKEELETIGGITYEKRPPEFAYIGAITLVRSAVEMVQAVGKLGLEKKVKLHIAGNFRPAEFRTELEGTAGWEFVTFHGWAGRTEVAEILGCTRAGIVICYPEPGYLDAQPVKLFEYMSASLPVIASDFPLWREIVKGAGAGLLVDPQSTDAISDAMVWLIDNPEQAKEMGKNGKRAVEEKYNWNIESKKLIAMYRDLIKVGQSTASQVE
jgi:glycosyltransferase involved in cell wall biosynthesis